MQHTAKNNLGKRCLANLFAVDKHSDLNLSNDAAMYLSGELRSMMEINDLSLKTTSLSACEEQIFVNNIFKVQSINVDHEF